MNYNEALDYIHSLGRFSHTAGLERIKLLLEKLNNPQNDFDAIHIAGTNGKGSVAVMVAEAFRLAGFKTGLYISPYIIRFNERIQINGEYISDEDLAEMCDTVKAKNVDCTEFEFITAAAFTYFAKEKCDIVIAETGLGGRFDATNALANKKVSVITKIGIDHAAVLGDTIEKITAEKCGIIGNSTTVTSPYQTQQALKVIRRSTNKLVVPDIAQLKVLKSDITGNSFIYKGREYETRLIGEHQIENALCAIEALENSGYNLPYNIIYKGIKNAFIPARLENVSSKRDVLEDGAHNPDAADRLARFIGEYKGSVGAIVGVMKDKDYDYILKRVLPLCKDAVAVKCADMPRALSAKELAKEVSKYCSCKVATNFDEAVNIAAEFDTDIIIAFGSLYLAANIREKLKEKFK